MKVVFLFILYYFKYLHSKFGILNLLSFLILCVLNVYFLYKTLIIHWLLSTVILAIFEVVHDKLSLRMKMTYLLMVLLNGFFTLHISVIGILELFVFYNFFLFLQYGSKSYEKDSIFPALIGEVFGTTTLVCLNYLVWLYTYVCFAGIMPEVPSYFSEHFCTEESFLYKSVKEVAEMPTQLAGLPWLQVFYLYSLLKKLAVMLIALECSAFLGLPENPIRKFLIDETRDVPPSVKTLKNISYFILLWGMVYLGLSLGFEIVGTEAVLIVSNLFAILLRFLGL